MEKHNCLTSRKERIATAKHPYHFTDSGLKNVYLVGVRYFTCECGRESVEIPALKQLMQLIARDLVMKQEALTGDEIRFLRKRLGKKAADFARDIGLEPETLSRMENGHQSASEPADKLIRLYYALSSDDRTLIKELRESRAEWLSSWRPQPATKKIVKHVTGTEWKAGAA